MLPRRRQCHMTNLNFHLVQTLSLSLCVCVCVCVFQLTMQFLATFACDFILTPNGGVGIWYIEDENGDCVEWPTTDGFVTGSQTALTFATCAGFITGVLVAIEWILCEICCAGCVEGIGFCIAWVAGGYVVFFRYLDRSLYHFGFGSTAPSSNILLTTCTACIYSYFISMKQIIITAPHSQCMESTHAVLVTVRTRCASGDPLLRT